MQDSRRVCFYCYIIEMHAHILMDGTALQLTYNAAIKSARIIQNLKCACALSHPPHKKDGEVNGVLHS